MEYFYGPDSYGAREALQKLAVKEKARLRWVDREQLELKNIADIVGQQHGFFGTDLVVIRDPSALPKDLQEDLAASVAGAGGKALWVAWDRVVPDKRSKLWRALSPYAEEWPAWQPAQLGVWLEKRAGELAGTLEKPAAQMLIARIGSDRWRLENELKRLLLVGEGSSVPLSLVEREVAAAEQSEIFTLLDALGRGQRVEAVRSAQALLAAGNNEFYILSMLGYQWRTLLVARAGLDERKSAAVVAREGKLHPYVVEKNLPIAGRLPYARWRDGLTRILATDFAIKQGKVDPRTGLLMLVITLSQSIQREAIVN